MDKSKPVSYPEKFISFLSIENSYSLLFTIFSLNAQNVNKVVYIWHHSIITIIIHNICAKHKVLFIRWRIEWLGKELRKTAPKKPVRDWIGRRKINNSICFNKFPIRFPAYLVSFLKHLLLFTFRRKKPDWICWNIYRTSPNLFK